MNNTRREKILKIVPVEALDLVTEIIDEVLHLEQQLEALKKLPFIEVHPQNPMKQRNTPAAKLYKEFLQQYINCIKVIEGVIYKEKRLEDDETEVSPLREWFNAHKK